MRIKKNFLDLKVPVFYNKKNGQISISLPKKKMKKIFNNKSEQDNEIPKTVPIRLFWWGKKGDKKK
jgi:hypothetical protein